MERVMDEIDNFARAAGLDDIMSPDHMAAFVKATSNLPPVPEAPRTAAAELKASKPKRDTGDIRAFVRATDNQPPKRPAEPEIVVEPTAKKSRPAHDEEPAAKKPRPAPTNGHAAKRQAQDDVVSEAPAKKSRPTPVKPRQPARVSQPGKAVKKLSGRDLVHLEASEASDSDASEDLHDEEEEEEEDDDEDADSMLDDDDEEEDSEDDSHAMHQRVDQEREHKKRNRIMSDEEEEDPTPPMSTRTIKAGDVVPGVLKFPPVGGKRNSEHSLKVLVPGTVYEKPFPVGAYPPAKHLTIVSARTIKDGVLLEHVLRGYVHVTKAGLAFCFDTAADLLEYESHLETKNRKNRWNRVIEVLGSQGKLEDLGISTFTLLLRPTLLVNDALRERVIVKQPPAAPSPRPVPAVLPEPVPAVKPPPPESTGEAASVAVVTNKDNTTVTVQFVTTPLAPEVYLQRWMASASTSTPVFVKSAAAMFVTPRKLVMQVTPSLPVPATVIAALLA